MKKSPGHLLLRADGDSKIGIGHVMRCLAIAQAWVDSDGTATLASASLPNSVRQRFADNSVEIISLETPRGSLEDANLTAHHAVEADRVVIDGYCFRRNFQERVRRASKRLLVIDDFCCIGDFCADIVLDANLGTSQELYSERPEDSILLLGSRFAPIRREFTFGRRRDRQLNDDPLKIMVTFGGSGNHRLIEQVLHALKLSGMRHLEVRVFMGPGQSNSVVSEDDLPENCRFEPFSQDMAEAMVWADVAISGAGSTCWELAVLGVPMALIVLADNQERVAAALKGHEAATLLGHADHISQQDLTAAVSALLQTPALLKKQARTAAAFLDAGGAHRVVEILRTPGSRGTLSPIALREVVPEDAQILWTWVNDPASRASAFDPTPISWETHQEWFRNHLSNISCTMLMAFDEFGFDVGQVRFEAISLSQAEIDVSVAPSKRGLGLGSRLIRSGCAEVAVAKEIHVVHAFIRPENESSRRAFEKSGFHLKGVTERKGHRALHFEWESGHDCS